MEFTLYRDDEKKKMRVATLNLRPIYIDVAVTLKDNTKNKFIITFIDGDDVPLLVDFIFGAVLASVPAFDGKGNLFTKETESNCIDDLYYRTSTDEEFKTYSEFMIDYTLGLLVEIFQFYNYRYLNISRDLMVEYLKSKHVDLKEILKQKIIKYGSCYQELRNKYYSSTYYEWDHENYVVGNDNDSHS